MNKLFLTLLLLALAAYGQVQERVAIINTLDDRDSIGFSELTYLTDRLRETAVNVLPSERFGDDYRKYSCFSRLNGEHREGVQGGELPCGAGQAG
ncbi:MAG: hypothetical protein LBC75_04560 [Fibromonadaceae bacterium]|jgi:hypothetical protein|nr:hypothetical protein [Fibromonadaceae bacterium]